MISTSALLVSLFACRRLLAFPKGNGDGIDKCLSLFLDVADAESLPNEWRRHTKYCLTVVNQISEKLSQRKVGQAWFYKEKASFGSQEICLLTKLLDQNSGFMVNGEVKIIVEFGVLEVVGKSDVLEETLLINESMNVHGFQVLPSQVESVNSLFEKHPDIASEFCPEHSQLRTAYLNSLLSLTEVLYQSKELSIYDLANAYCTLSYVTKAGFKLGWLEKKLKEVGQSRLQEIEKKLKDLKQNCADIDALLEFVR